MTETRYHLVCRTCADNPDQTLKHEALTRNAGFAEWARIVHESKGHDVELAELPAP